jgi:hypothetical protein
MLVSWQAGGGLVGDGLEGLWGGGLVGQKMVALWS